MHVLELHGTLEQRVVRVSREIGAVGDDRERRRHEQRIAGLLGRRERLPGGALARRDVELLLVCLVRAQQQKEMSTKRRVVARVLEGFVEDGARGLDVVVEVAPAQQRARPGRARQARLPGAGRPTRTLRATCLPR